MRNLIFAADFLRFRVFGYFAENGRGRKNIVDIILLLQSVTRAYIMKYV